MPLRRLIATLLLFLGLVGPCAAGALDDAMAAYCRGEYAAALRLFRPLAEWGDQTAKYYVCSIHRSGLAPAAFGADPLDLAIERATCTYSLLSAPSRNCNNLRFYQQMDSLNEKEPGRYVAMSPEEYRQWQMRPRAQHLTTRPQDMVTPGPALATNPQMRVPLKPTGGVFAVPVELNGAIKLNFTVDSGAADVSIPLDVFSTLRRTGSIKPADLLGSGTYVLADGSKAKALRFRIRSLNIGGIVLKNVPASVSTSEGVPLLGQSFLQRFKSWSIDNNRHELDLAVQ